jgi:glycine cleavage system H lipoate-binding protein
MVAIFVLLTVLTFVAIEYARRRSTAKQMDAAAIRTRSLSERFLIPKGFFLGQAHTWVEILYSGQARIGLDDFIQKIVGKIDKIEVAPINSTVQKGEALIQVRHGNRTLTIPAPMSGRVGRINLDLLSDPEKLHQDPYVGGWIAEIMPTDMAADVRTLPIAEEAARWLRGEVSRFRDFIQSQAGTPATAGVTALDGGLPLTGVMEQFSEKTWEAFEHEFLSGQRER